jgi:tRNA nucleotidyltransferase (CCA-adding enzyme)
MKPFPVIPNCKLYLAGGYVRDYLLGKEPEDRDFVVLTEMSFEELVLQIEKIGKIFQIKPEFLTIRCIINDEIIDLVMPREESDYADGRHPNNVKRVNSLKEDSARRDFTINSMYMEEDGHIIDYWNGQDDLKNHNLKCVGNPEDRFKEDYLRILRGLRFLIKYNLHITNDLFFIMRELSYNLKNISMERIREEINKMLKLDTNWTFELLNELNIFGILKDKGLHFELSSTKVKK